MVSEEDEYLEVCIRLASTGSSGELLSSVEVNITFEDKSATGMFINCHCLKGVHCYTMYAFRWKRLHYKY